MSVRPEKTTPELLEEANRIGIDFLRIEVEATLTFIRVAETSSKQETRIRNYGNACEGYRSLLHFLPHVVLDPRESAEIREKIEDLKLRLEQAEHSCGS